MATCKLKRASNLAVSGLRPDDDAWQTDAADEYDGYVLHVASLLRRGGSTDEAVAYLDEIASEHMGLGPITEVRHASSERTVAAVAVYLMSLPDTQ